MSFGYELPSNAVARAAVDIGHVAVTIELFLSGDLEVRATQSTVDGESPRGAVMRALRNLAKGLMVRGLGSATPSIVSAAGHEFTQRRHEFRAPNTITFAGDCEIDFGQRRERIDVTMAGVVGYCLEVTAMPTAGEPPAPDDTNGRGWFVRHDKELASIGMVVLVAVPIPPARLVARDER